MSSRRIHTGRVVSLDLEQLVLPNGEAVELEIVRHPGGAAVVALDAGGSVCLLRQYRHAAGGWIRELPAGKLEPGQGPLETARRELAEEAGLAAADWHALGSMVSSPGVFTEVVHLFLARDLRAVPAEREHGELFQVGWMPLPDAVAAALSGEITDAKTALGLLRAAAAVRSPGRV